MQAPPPPDSNPAPSDRLWLRSELMGTQVITRDTGRRLGVVGEVMVDIDRREVVALGLRDNPLTRFLPGLPRWMLLEQIRQVGDVILVDSVDSLSEKFNPERYSRVINSQVISEAGEQLGRVLGFSFDVETGELTTLVMGAVGVPLLGEGILSTWELTVEEIVSSGPDRIIVYEGAEEKLKQLSSGILEKLGIGGGNLEREERERYRLNMVPVENQLPAAQATEQEQRRLQANQAERFAPAASQDRLRSNYDVDYSAANAELNSSPDYDYVELEQRTTARQQQRRRYLDEDQEENNYQKQPRYSDSGYGNSRYDNFERSREPLDVEAEPLDDRANKAPNPVDDDPWA
ncbi:PRC-barrel domain-containing protein [Synechococcus sp. UW140]|uniref:PRC-barrel domain-containing protein n=1 Tax=Synechococcus sp. UW140 TaxID=368503 RepID=UPI0031379C70